MFWFSDHGVELKVVLQDLRRPLKFLEADLSLITVIGGTLFDLKEISAEIREKTSHLPGVSIAIMGCIVNGPGGEMADADFGYVGGALGKIDLYVWKVKLLFLFDMRYGVVFGFSVSVIKVLPNPLLHAYAYPLYLDKKLEARTTSSILMMFEKLVIIVGIDISLA